MPPQPIDGAVCGEWRDVTESHSVSITICRRRPSRATCSRRSLVRVRDDSGNGLDFQSRLILGCKPTLWTSATSPQVLMGGLGQEHLDGPVPWAEEQPRDLPESRDGLRE